MTFGFIEAEKASFPISRVCRVLGVSQSGFFAWQDRPACRRQQQDMVCLAHIRTAFALSNGTYGSPRMHCDLVDEGHEVGRHRTARLMRENQLIARQKRRFKRTTDSEHSWPVAPNLIAQDFTADGPDQKGGADISYIWTAEGWLYLAVVLDLFSRRVVAWATSDRLKRDLAVEALRRALVARNPASGLVHHSDRGSQYCSVNYQALLRKRGILISLSAIARNRLPAMDERARELLRQSDGRNVLQDHQVGADLAVRMAIPPAGRKRHRQIHRRVL
jgi:putative transposase